MTKRYFITGTDTGVGKTFFSCQWLAQLKQAGRKTIALKPLASGCVTTPNGLRNDDALLLQAAASIALPYAAVNPFAFEPAIAPHIAAALQGTTLQAKMLAQAIMPALKIAADCYVIEGAGGLLMPLNATETWIDFIREIEADIILVVGMRLGCLNHALLTYEAIRQSGCTLTGWVANPLDPAMPYLAENIATLKARFMAPLLT